MENKNMENNKPELNEMENSKVEVPETAAVEMEAEAMDKSIEKKRRLSKPVKLAIVVVLVLAAVCGSAYAAGIGPVSGGISEKEARRIALEQVPGATDKDIVYVRKDFDDGRTEYDAKIVYDGFEYEFEIAAKDGTIYDQSREAIATYENAPSPQQDNHNTITGNDVGNVVVNGETGDGANEINAEPQGAIDMATAQAIALKQVPGATAGNITSAEQDNDHGRTEYDIEIYYNGYEYDFEIDGSNGRIISKEVDAD